MGKMKRGGMLDVFAAARSVLNDWNSGRIKYFTHPPEVQETHVSAKIISGGDEAKEFDLEKLLEMETEMMDTITDGESKDVTKFITIESSGPVEMANAEGGEEDMETDEDDDDASGDDQAGLSKLISKRTKIVEDDDEEDMKPSTSKKFKKAAKKQVDQEMQLEGNQTSNKNSKKQMKKAKKQVQKTEKRLNKVGDIFDNLNLKSEKGDDYSFEVDY